MQKRTDNKPTKTVKYNLDPGIFHDPRFLTLPGAKPSSALLLLYLMSGPLAQMARIPGLIFAGVGTLADHLKWTYQQVQDFLAELISSGWVAMDQHRNIIWVSRSAKINPPDNPSVIRGWASVWEELGDSSVRASVWDDLHAVIKQRGEAYEAAFREVFQTVTRDGVAHGVHHPVETPWGDTVGGHRVSTLIMSAGSLHPSNGDVEDNHPKIYMLEWADTCGFLGAEALGVAGVGFRLGVSVPCLFSSERSEEDTQDLKGHATSRKRIPARLSPDRPSPDRPSPDRPRPTPDTRRATPGRPVATPAMDSPSVSTSVDAGVSSDDDADFESSSEAMEVSPYKELYVRWNRLAEISGSHVYRIVAKQIKRLDEETAKKLESDPNFIATAKELIDGIAHHQWLLGVDKFKDGRPFRMHFTTLLTKTEWVHDKLLQHRKEQRRKERDGKASGVPKRGRGPAPISDFEPETAGPSVDNDGPRNDNPYCD